MSRRLVLPLTLSALAALGALAGCSGAAAEPIAPPPTAVSESCGTSPGDWCPPARAGDACGAHPDESSCRSDPRCEAIPYRGESVVPCIGDERCFATNCPAVGCTMRCEALDETTCEQGRCQWDGEHCTRIHPCGPPR